MTLHFTKLSSPHAQRLLVLLFIVVLAFTVRALTANFLRAHFDDPGWFQFTSYRVFDRQAQDILDQKAAPFWITDSSRTDQMIHPPGYPLWMASIYAVTGDRSPVAMQRVQLVLDSLSVLLLVGIGVTAFGWRAGIAAGVLGAWSPLLALAGATPNADAPTSWVVLGAVWLFLLAAKRHSISDAVAAGALLGLACWMRVNPLFLFVAWTAALVLFVKASWRRRLGLGAAISMTTLLVISPVVIRNVVAFYPEFAPTGLNVGLNLWEGIGETERGSEFGAPGSDAEVIAQDRKEMGLAPDAPLGLNYPDGIRRDRERGRRALAVIKKHPLWFAGVMARRVWGHLKFAGSPAPHVGSAGFNVTARKCLSADRQSGILALFVNILGMIQSVSRYVALPLTLLGIWLAWRRERVTLALLLSTVIYYLATLAVGHSEIRYGLPMQAILIVFAGVALSWLSSAAFQLQRPKTASAGQRGET